MKRVMYEVHVERDGDGNIIIKQPEAMDSDGAIVLLSPDQIDLVCLWLREARGEA